MQAICVYQHRRPDTGDIFYIGKGPARRVCDKRHRNPHWNAIAAKVGYVAEVICDGLDDKHALELEILLIGFHGRRDLGTGTLVNMTDGGDGVRGRIMPPVTAETRAKLRVLNTGRTQTPEAREKIRQARTGHIKSDLTLAKISAALKGRKRSAAYGAARPASAPGEKKANTMPQEQRDKISLALKGRKKTPEHVAASVAAIRGIPKKGSASPYCGVSKDKDRWRAVIGIPGGKMKYLGLYDTQEDAARAYDKASLAMYGATARLNFPQLMTEEN